MIKKYFFTKNNMLTLTKAIITAMPEESERIIEKYSLEIKKEL